MYKPAYVQNLSTGGNFITFFHLRLFVELIEKEQ